MFRSFVSNVAADALGLGELAQVIEPKDFDKVDSKEFLFHEDNEQIHAVLKSKEDEYCFTNLALVHMDGTSAASKKRKIKRYLYKDNRFSDVGLQTAGTVDLDVELYFTLGSTAFSVDVKKDQIEMVRDLYKALVALADLGKNIDRRLEHLRHTQNAVFNMIDLHDMPAEAIVNLPDIINQTIEQVEEYHSDKVKKIQSPDFGSVFNRYIRW